MQYTLQTAKNKDKTGVMRVLGVLAQNIKGRVKMMKIWTWSVWWCDWFLRIFTISFDRIF